MTIAPEGHVLQEKWERPSFFVEVESTGTQASTYGAHSLMSSKRLNYQTRFEVTVEIKDMSESTLTGVVCGLVHHPANPEVADFDSGQGACLGWGFTPVGGVREATDRCFFFSLSSPLSKK